MAIHCSRKRVHLMGAIVLLAGCWRLLPDSQPSVAGCGCANCSEPNSALCCLHCRLTHCKLCNMSQVLMQGRGSTALTQLLDNWNRNKSAQLSISSLGGSASATSANYAHYLRLELCAKVSDAECERIVVSNPSQGSTGSVWASLFMTSLLPRTDLLIWEFGINDWEISDTFDPDGVAERTVKYQALFLRRALALNPNILLLFVHLWQRSAARCFPKCSNDQVPFEAASSQLQHDELLMKHTIAHLDVNQLAKHKELSPEELFSDNTHHMADVGQREVSAALSQVLLPPLEAALHNQHSTELRAHTRVTAPPLAEASCISQKLFSKLLEPSCKVASCSLNVSGYSELSFEQVQSFVYSMPMFGEQMRTATSAARILTAGRADPTREDRKRYVLLPSCGEGAVEFETTSTNALPLYIGVNLLDTRGAPLWGTWDSARGDDGAWNVKVDSAFGDLGWHAAEQVSQLAPDAEVLVIKGGHEPQAWFTVASLTRDNPQVRIRVCVPINSTRLAIGGVVLV